jgi:hypothetical protein
VWADSAGKHGISRADVLWAIQHAVGSEELNGRLGWTTRVWVGHPHSQTERYIEVIGASRGAEFVIFHAMPLNDVYRHLIHEEN